MPRLRSVRPFPVLTNPDWNGAVMKRLAWATALAVSLAVRDGRRGELAEALHDVRSASATEVWRHHFDEDVLAASFSQNGRHVVIAGVAKEK